MKQIRARLYMDMGLETVEKMATQDPQELVKMARAHVEQTGFNGIPTLPGLCTGYCPFQQVIK